MIKNKTYKLLQFREIFFLIPIKKKKELQTCCIVGKLINSNIFGNNLLENNNKFF